MAFTVLALAPADTGPRRRDFLSLEAHGQAWHLWSAVRRDGRLNPAEAEAKVCATVEYFGWDGC